MQKMMTKEILRKAPSMYSTDGQGYEAVAVAHYFSCMGGLAGWDWYMTEYDPETQEAFGLVLGYEKELGYFSIREFEEINRRYGLNVIERDMYFTPTKLCNVA